jgi:hypothetical protein
MNSGASTIAFVLHRFVRFFPFAFSVVPQSF